MTAVVVTITLKVLVSRTLADKVGEAALKGVMALRDPELVPFAHDIDTVQREVEVEQTEESVRQAMEWSSDASVDVHL